MGGTSSGAPSCHCSLPRVSSASVSPHPGPRAGGQHCAASPGPAQPVQSLLLPPCPARAMEIKQHLKTQLSIYRDAEPRCNTAISVTSHHVQQGQHLQAMQVFSLHRSQSQLLAVGQSFPEHGIPKPGPGKLSIPVSLPGCWRLQHYLTA